MIIYNPYAKNVTHQKNLKMAKELPYFKFEPNQWDNGNIQMLSREDKGLFVDLCSMYWSRLGDVPLKLATQKLCAGNATALKSLVDEKIIKVLNGNIFITFLSEQLNEFEDVSKQNSKNALEGWEKRRKQKEESDRKATASISQCENNAIREDKTKEEEIKEEEIKEDVVLFKKEPKKQNRFNFKKSLIKYGFKEKLVSDWISVRKTKKATNSETAFDNFISEIETRNYDINEMLEIAVTNSWSGFKYKWVDNLNQNQNGGKNNNSSATNDDHKQSAVEAVNALFGRQ